MKKIIYLGQMDEYITLLKSEIARSIPDCELICQSKAGVYHSYKAISQFKPQIVLINYSEQQELGTYFPTMIKKGLGNITFVLLSPNKDTVVEVEKLSTLGDLVHIIKNPTANEVVEYIAKKLAIPRIGSTNHRKIYFKDSLQLFYAMRIAQLGRTHAQIETNRFYENDSTIQLTLPFMVDLINSGRHKLTKRSTEAIYSHFRYSYQLEYLFQTNKLESAARSRQIKDLRYEISTLEVNEKAYQGIIEATKEKKLLLAEDKKKEIKNISEEALEQNELELLSRTVFFNRLIKQNMDGYVTRDIISIYDNQALLLKEFEKIEKNNVHIIHRDEIGDSNVEMVSDKPSLIVVHLDEKNTIEKVKKMISAVTLLKDHFPFILIFNYQGHLSSDDLRHWLEYHFVLAAPDQPYEYILTRMLEIYRRKKQEKEIQKAEKRLKDLMATDLQFIKVSEKFLLDYKAYKNLHDPEALIIKSLPADVIWFSETEIKFTTNEPIEIGEIFRLKSPFDMQIEVMSKEKVDQNATTFNYVAHMHFLAETDKMAIKGFLDELAQQPSLAMDEEQISSLKEKYFPFKFDFNL